MADEDRELWDSAATDAPTAEPPAPEPVAEAPQDSGTPRDERGRFAPRAEERAVEPSPAAPAPEAASQPPQRQAEDHAAIPTWRLREEAEARRTAEQRLNDLQRQYEATQARLRQIEQSQQPQQEVPDVFENPQGFQSHITQTFEQKLRAQEVNFSMRLAHMQYKGDFDEAYSAALRRREAGDMATIQSILNSQDPGEALVRWHRQQKLYEQTGGDLTAYLTKRQEELLEDEAFLARAAEKIRARGGQQAQSRPPVTQLPPSLNRLASAAPTTADDEDLSDGGLLKQALRR